MPFATDETIREICETASDRRSFYDRFLKIVGNQTGAVSGVVWDCRESPFRPIAQIQSTSSGVLKVGISESEHNELLKQAAVGMKSVLVMPKPDAGGTMPFDHPVILISLVERTDHLELVELFLPPGGLNDDCQSRLKQLEKLCQSARAFEGSAVPLQRPSSPIHSTNEPISPFLANPPVPRKTNVQDRLDEFANRIHRSLDLKDTALEIANELRRVLDCDRVSVVLHRGQHGKILAISGQPSVNSRSNTVQGLLRLVDRVLPLRSRFWYPTDDPLPEQISKSLNPYLADSSTRTLIVEPIFALAKIENSDPRATPIEPTLIGGIVIEHCQMQLSRDQLSEAIEMTTRHAANAFRNSYQHRQLLFYPLWKWLGKSKIVMAAKNLRLTTAVLAVLTITGLLLAFLPAEFRLNCDGHLVPENRSNVFSEIDGTVSSLLVQHGDAVVKGQPLLKIENHDFMYERQELVGQIDELEQAISATESKRLSERSSEEKQTRQQNLQAQKAQLASYRTQLVLVDKKLERLTITSPSTGKVVTWNLAETLRGRPVSRGEILLEIADVDGDWELELDLSDRKAGHLLTALRKQRGLHGLNGEPKSLSVDFLLAADPNQRFRGAIKEIGSATEINPDSGQTIRVAVEIDAREFDIRQVKSGVSARIHCGRRSLGYVWFHPVWEFVQSKILFPFF